MSIIEALIVAFDYEGTGLWHHFGGKADLLTAKMINGSHYGIPDDICEAIMDWNALFGSFADLSNKGESICDPEKVSVAQEVANCFFLSGIYLAKEVKKHWDESVYYHYYSDNPETSKVIDVVKWQAVLENEYLL